MLFLRGGPVGPPLSLDWCVGWVGKYCQGPCRICHMPCRCHMAFSVPRFCNLAKKIENSCLGQPRQAARRVLAAQEFEPWTGQARQDNAAQGIRIQPPSQPTSQPRQPHNPQGSQPCHPLGLGSALQVRERGGGGCRPTEINKAVRLCGDAHCRVYHVD